MKKFATLILASVSLVLTAAAQPRVLWTQKAGIDTPESVYFDAQSQRLFVSNVVGQAAQKDGKGYVAEIVEGDGKREVKVLVDGLDAPKGLRAKDGVLWVTNIDEMVAIDLKTNKIKERIKVEGAQFLNDDAIAADGTVYASDMLASKIYQIKDGKVSVFAAGDQLESPNGLLIQGNRLVVAAWGLITDPASFGVKAPGHLYALDLKTKAKTLITKSPLGNLDGLEFDGQDFLVSDFAAAKVFRVNAQGEAKLIFTGEHNAADIGLEGKTLFVPEMGGSDVLALAL